MRLLLLSGGMDSAVCLKRYGATLAIGFDYGQPHKVELEFAERLAEGAGVPFHVVRIPPLPKVDDIVFAGRNAVMLAIGAAIAQAKKLQTVVIGCNFDDAMRFPDCRPEFILAMDKAMTNAYGVGVSAPLLRTTKAQIKREAEGLDTWTCYQPKDGRPCGECYSCKAAQC